MNVNVNALQEYLKNKDFQKTAGFAFGCIAVLAAVYGCLIFPQHGKMGALTKDAAGLEGKMRQYLGFSSFKEKLGQQREQVSKTLEVVEIEQTPADKSDEGVYEAIGRVCNKVDIRLDKITPVKNDKGQLWHISFKAPYSRITSFASQLEKSFKIDTLDIAGGKTAYVHTVTMIVYPIDIPVLAEVPASQGKDLFDLYNEVDTALKALEKNAAAAGAVPSIGRDPMAFGDTLFYTERREPVREAAQKEKNTVQERPAIPVEAIFWDPDMPLVSIGGKVCKEGDTQNDYTIVKIREKSVDVKWRSRVFTYEPK